MENVPAGDRAPAPVPVRQCESHTSGAEGEAAASYTFYIDLRIRISITDAQATNGGTRVSLRRGSGSPGRSLARCRRAAAFAPADTARSPLLDLWTAA